MDKMCAKAMYKCAVCGGVYDSITHRKNCEQACLKKKEEEERKAAEAKRAEEKEMRKNAVDEAIKKTAALLEAYLVDYGHYKYEGEPVKNFFLPWPNDKFDKFWSLF